MLDIEPPEDILGFLRDLDLRGEATGVEQEAADEIEQLRARVERAEADADRLAANLSRMPCACTWRSYGVIGYRCTKCVVLDLHDREVEAR